MSKRLFGRGDACAYRGMAAAQDRPAAHLQLQGWVAAPSGLSVNLKPCPVAVHNPTRTLPAQECRGNHTPGKTRPSTAGCC